MFLGPIFLKVGSQTSRGSWVSSLGRLMPREKGYAGGPTARKYQGWDAKHVLGWSVLTFCAPSSAPAHQPRPLEILFPPLFAS